MFSMNVHINYSATDIEKYLLATVACHSHFPPQNVKMPFEKFVSLNVIFKNDPFLRTTPGKVF